MKIYLSTFYFDQVVIKKINYLSLESCIFVIENSIFRETQNDGRIRHWAIIENKYLRVVSLSDGLTLHNAFFDRSFNLTKRGLG